MSDHVHAAVTAKCYKPYKSLSCSEREKGFLNRDQRKLRFESWIDLLLRAYDAIILQS